MRRRRRETGGFVLIELLVVIGLIGLIAAVSFPYLLPAIAYSEIEGAARHLSNYGKSVMAQCALMRERIVVKVDLENQEYWCVRWREDDNFFDETGEDGKTSEDKGLFDHKDSGTNQGGDAGLFGTGGGTNAVFGTGGDAAGLLGMDEDALAEQAMAMDMSFERFARMSLQARARNARRESILDEIGPLFDKEFSLDDEEDHEEELAMPLLQRTRVPTNIRIESVYVGNAEQTSGVIEIELSPLGLMEPVTFYVTNDDERYFTVEWDPITSGTYVYDGKKDRE